jgi:hypothetical protein
VHRQHNVLLRTWNGPVPPPDRTFGRERYAGQGASPGGRATSGSPQRAEDDVGAPSKNAPAPAGFILGMLGILLCWLPLVGIVLSAIGLALCAMVARAASIVGRETPVTPRLALSSHYSPSSSPY